MFVIFHKGKPCKSHSHLYRSASAGEADTPSAPSLHLSVCLRHSWAASDICSQLTWVVLVSLEQSWPKDILRVLLMTLACSLVFCVRRKHILFVEALPRLPLPFSDAYVNSCDSSAGSTKLRVNMSIMHFIKNKIVYYKPVGTS